MPKHRPTGTVSDPTTAPARVDFGAQCTSLAILFRAVAAAACLAALGACGGGGGSTPAPPPPPPPPSGPLEAQLSVPTPIGYDGDRLAAFNRLNEVRLSAGLGMLAQQALMDQAAQAHAEWEVANNVYGHVETAGTAGFAGVEWWDRDEALGYTPATGGEDVSSGYAAVAAVNAFVNGAYHRIAILTFESVDVGIGRSTLNASHVSTPVVIDMAVPQGDRARGLGQRAQASIAGAAIWPLDGSQGVATHMGIEMPNPVPGTDVGLLGTPVSITVASSNAIAASRFGITNLSTGAEVPTIVLDHASDPNGELPRYYIAAIPLGPLDPHTTYAVAFSGRVTSDLPGASTDLVRNWQFSTGAE
jgi:uncharacterized protein YkwD